MTMIGGLFAAFGRVRRFGCGGRDQHLYGPGWGECSGGAFGDLGRVIDLCPASGPAPVWIEYPGRPLAKRDLNKARRNLEEAPDWAYGGSPCVNYSRRSDFRVSASNGLRPARRSAIQPRRLSTRSAYPEKSS
jgi:hypothetical protein